MKKSKTANKATKKGIQKSKSASITQRYTKLDENEPLPFMLDTLFLRLGLLYSRYSSFIFIGEICFSGSLSPADI